MGQCLARAGLLYDSNVVWVLAARGLERNSFPSHSFSWHLSPLFFFFFLFPSHPQLQSSHPLSLPASLTLPRAQELRSLQQAVKASCHPAWNASVTVPMSWRAGLVLSTNIASIFSPTCLTRRAALWEKSACFKRVHSKGKWLQTVCFDFLFNLASVTSCLMFLPFGPNMTDVWFLFVVIIESTNKIIENVLTASRCVRSHLNPWCSACLPWAHWHFSSLI